MLRHLTHQVRQKLLDVFAWDDGTYAFHRDKVFEQEAAPLGLDAFEVLAAGVTALPAELLAERLENAMQHKLRAVSPPLVPPDVFRVGGYPSQVYDQLDGERTLAELLDRSEDPDATASFARMTYLLLECGLASLE